MPDSNEFQMIPAFLSFFSPFACYCLTKELNSQFALRPVIICISDEKSQAFFCKPITGLSDQDNALPEEIH